MKKKKRISWGFFTKGINPTQNAINMYWVYYLNLPDGWDESIICESAVQAVREWFDYYEENSFVTMIHWGLHPDCGHSRSSDERHIALHKASNEAKGNIAKGYILTKKPIYKW